MQNKDSLELDYSLKILAKSSFIVFIGVVISKIATYSYRIIIARSFGTEIYGLFSLVLMISGFFVAFFSLGLQSGLLRYISFYRGKNEKEKIQYIFRFSLKLLFPISILAGILLFLSSEYISLGIFHNPNLIVFIKWFAFFVPVLIFAGTFHAIIRAYEKIRWYSFIGNILMPSVQLILLVIFIFFNLKDRAIILSYNLGILSMVISSFLIFKYKIPEVLQKPKIKKRERLKLIKSLFSYSWPIIFFGLTMAIFGWIDSFTIGYFKTASDVGIYNAAVPIALLLGIAPLLFLQLFFPLVMREYSRKNFTLINQLSKQIAKWIFIFNLPFVIIMILFPGAIINILFGTEFIQANNALRMLSVGVFFYSLLIISENLLSMMGKSRVVLTNLMIASIVNIFLNVLLVPRYGINGAAFSTMLSYILWSVLSFFIAKHHTSIVPLKRKMIKITFVALIPILILFFIKRFFEINFLTMIILGLLFILSYFFLILVTKCFDENDLIVLRAIKKKILFKSLKDSSK